MERFKRLRSASFVVNTARNPLGIDVAKPRLSWVMESDQRNERQTAYRVLVALLGEKLAKDEGDLWDSGQVAL